jgi:glutathione S-transferase
VKLYDNAASANAMKARIALRQLGVRHETVPVDLFAGETRSEAHLARNPAGQVPVLELDSGEHIPESGAILLYAAEDSSLLPGDRVARARVHQWLFFEQNQVESSIAVARFMALTGRAAAAPEFFAALVARGRAALKTLERGLADGRPFVAGEAYSVADIALYAYVHCGADAGVDPARRPAVTAWLERVAATDGFGNDLAPFPAHAMA